MLVTTRVKTKNVFHICGVSLSPRAPTLVGRQVGDECVQRYGSHLLQKQYMLTLGETPRAASHTHGLIVVNVARDRLTQIQPVEDRGAGRHHHVKSCTQVVNVSLTGKMLPHNVNGDCTLHPREDNTNRFTKRMTKRL